MNYSKDNNDKKLKRKDAYTKKTSNRIWTFIKSAIIVLLLIGIFGTVGIMAGAYFGILKNAPDINEMVISPDVFTTVIYSDVTGEEIATLDADENREYVELDQIPLWTQEAFVAIEDERFYEHNGIDLKGIIRSAFVIFTTDRTQGASTITQQVIKNSRGLTSNNIVSKLQEQYMAVTYEKQLTKELGSKKAAKDQILEYYLNIINLGNDIHGVQAASKYYFNKDVSQLDIAESATIAAITQLPSRYNPAKNPDANKERRDVVLQKMLEQGYITQDEYDQAMLEDVYGEIASIHPDNEGSSTTNSYFVDHLIDVVKEDLMEEYGYTESQASNILFNQGLQIYATQDPEIQEIVDEVYLDDSYFPSADYKIEVTFNISVQNTITDEVTHYHRKKTVKTEEEIEPFLESVRGEVVGQNDEIIAETVLPVVQPQSAFTIIENGTGKVLAIEGGRGEKLVDRGLNRATDSLIQPGSTFKVLAAYAPGIDTNANGMTAGKVYMDEPYTIDGYSPRNWWGDTYRGPSTVREGIRDSMNIIAVKAMVDTGIDTSWNYLQNFGFTTLVDSKEINGKIYTDKTYSTALGGLTDGVSNLELTAAYQTIANGGVYVEPTFYTKVLDHDGNVILDNTHPETHRVLKETTAYILTDIMEDVVTSGTGTAARFTNVDMPIAGKSGTTSETKDLNFVGYTPYLTAGIWSGNDTPSTITGGSSYHKKIWSTIMGRVHEEKGYPYKEFDIPDGLVYVDINRDTGLLPIVPNGPNVYTEVFEKGTEPTEKGSIDINFDGLIDEENGLHYYIDPSTGEKMYLIIDVESGEYRVVPESELDTLPSEEPEPTEDIDGPIITEENDGDEPTDQPGISIGIPGMTEEPEVPVPTPTGRPIETTEPPFEDTESEEPVIIPEYSEEIGMPIIDDSNY